MTYQYYVHAHQYKNQNNLLLKIGVSGGTNGMLRHADHNNELQGFLI